jgi:hypothetical protein
MLPARPQGQHKASSSVYPNRHLGLGEATLAYILSAARHAASQAFKHAQRDQLRQFLLSNLKEALVQVCFQI